MADPVETLVIHPGALGDVLQAVPALTALGRLGSQLTFAGQPRLGELLQGSGLVLAATPFDTFGLEALFADGPVPARLASRLGRFRRVVSWFGAREPDYAGRLGALAPEVIVAPPVPDDESPLAVWEHLVDTLAPWGVTQPALLHPLPTTERWRIAARTALMALGVDEARPLLIAHPGAGARWKRAPAARFALALERMRGDGGFEVVVHQGPADAEAVEAPALGQRQRGSRRAPLPGGSRAAAHRAPSRAAHLRRVRPRLPRAAFRRALCHRVWLGPHGGPAPVLRDGAAGRRAPGARRLHGDDGRRPGHHGGRQPRRPGGGRAVHRLQHRAAEGAEAERVPRPVGDVPPLLRPQGHAREVFLRLRRPARRVRDAR